jgi:hypothetical protein
MRSNRAMLQFEQKKKLAAMSSVYCAGINAMTCIRPANVWPAYDNLCHHEELTDLVVKLDISLV